MSLPKSIRKRIKEKLNSEKVTSEAGFKSFKIITRFCRRIP